ncbi:hypothetical protein PtrSN002B_000302 [Pyrenophora tritici-repentis]|nr:hypothetical protein A1F94_003248 [Pyrenophora tritici-repentis]KAI0589755.1 hypothetical protein Alg215_00217 [Pyrenophora tritici-repentis]KAI0623791.1 hypothetical protein TUN199_04210 [Pyrenophora tritici-repentis]KAI1558613.1 hypothetical protein PtrSN002B_000302 [Pyrenophora tritici-repentis]KAI1607796.1 hypothetical protein PtrCC142_000047 [Pyrenophora tritici-repentis]
MPSTNVAAKDPTSKPKETKPELKDNDTGRIKNRLECAYRVCHINALLRRDLHKAYETIRSNREAAKKQVVQEDALNEMRQELFPTRKLVDRFWNLLGQRKVKVPEDLRASYIALKSMSLDNLGPKKAAKAAKKAAGKLKAAAKPLNKAQRRTEKKERERKEREANSTTLFLLHDLDGETYDVRKPIAIAEDSGRPPTLSTPKSVPEKIVPPQVIPPFGLVPDNVVAGVKRKSDDSESVTAIKMPTIEEDAKTDKVDGVKRKADDSEPMTAAKMPRIEDETKTDDTEGKKRNAEDGVKTDEVAEVKGKADDDAKTDDVEGENRKAEDDAKTDGVQEEK